MILPPSKSSSAKSDVVSNCSPISKAKSSTVSSSASLRIFLGVPGVSSQSKGMVRRSEKFLVASNSLYSSVILRGLVGALKKQPEKCLGEDGAVKLTTSIFFCISLCLKIVGSPMRLKMVSRGMSRRELKRTKEGERKDRA